jgi:hypothetical protein
VKFDKLAVQAISSQQGMIHDLRDDERGAPGGGPQILIGNPLSGRKQSEHEAKEDRWGNEIHRSRLEDW